MLWKILFNALQSPSVRSVDAMGVTENGEVSALAWKRALCTHTYMLDQSYQPIPLLSMQISRRSAYHPRIQGVRALREGQPCSSVASKKISQPPKY